MKDIARKAGVSVMTVSYVLNNTKNQTISEATRARVLEAAEALQYVPNAAAKSLRTSRSACIGVVAGQNISQRRLSAALEGIRSALENSGYDMLLTSGRAEDGGLPAYVGEFTRNRIDGVLYISQTGSRSRSAERNCSRNGTFRQQRSMQMSGRQDSLRWSLTITTALPSTLPTFWRRTSGTFCTCVRTATRSRRGSGKRA